MAALQTQTGAQRVTEPKELSLNEDVVSVIVQSLEFIDALALLQNLLDIFKISRMLYFSYGLWIYLLDRRGSQYPLACSPSADIHALPFPKLRKVGFHTGALVKSWSRPRPKVRNWKRLSLPASRHIDHHILGVIPGEGVLLTHTQSNIWSVGLTVKAWDLTNSVDYLLELAGCSWKEHLIHQWGRSSFSRLHLVGPGRARFAFFLTKESNGYLSWLGVNQKIVEEWIVVAELDYTNRHLVTMREIVKVKLVRNDLKGIKDVSWYSTLSNRGVTIAVTDNATAICFAHVDIPVEPARNYSFPKSMDLSLGLTTWDQSSDNLRLLELMVHSDELYIQIVGRFFRCHGHFPLAQITEHHTNLHLTRLLTPLREQLHDRVHAIHPRYMVFVYYWRSDQTAYTRCAPMRVDSKTKDLIFSQRPSPSSPDDPGIKDEGYSCSNNALISYSGRTIIHPKDPDWKQHAAFTSYDFILAQCGWDTQREKREIVIPDDVGWRLVKSVEDGKAFLDECLGTVVFQVGFSQDLYFLECV